jgi:hypothetical protein
MLITTPKKKHCLDYIEKLNTFFQVRMFGHRVSFRHLHKGLRPFINVGMHNRGL